MASQWRGGVRAERGHEGRDYNVVSIDRLH